MVVWWCGGVVMWWYGAPGPTPAPAPPPAQAPAMAISGQIHSAATRLQRGAWEHKLVAERRSRCPLACLALHDLFGGFFRGGVVCLVLARRGAPWRGVRGVAGRGGACQGCAAVRFGARRACGASGCLRRFLISFVAVGFVWLWRGGAGRDRKRSSRMAPSRACSARVAPMVVEMAS